MKNDYVRIFLKQTGETYKLLNFSTSKDNSFHFHLYEEKDKKLEYHPIKKLPDGTSKIELKKLEKTEFLRNKFTFHPSGVLHSSDKVGGRFKDGLKGISFKHIEDSNLILMIAPKQINRLQKAQIPNKGINLILELEDEINPFTLNFEVFRKSKRDDLRQIPVKFIHGPHTIEWPHLEFGLRFYTQGVYGDPLWPTKTMVLKRIIE